MMGRLAAFLAMISLSAAAPAQAPVPPPAVAIAQPAPRPDPEIWMNLELTRQIVCREGNNIVTGTGFLIAPNIMVSAEHVVRAGRTCWDYATRATVFGYMRKRDLDFALARFDRDPTPYQAYQRYSCEGFMPGQTYYAVGIAGGHSLVITRLVATDQVSGQDFEVPNIGRLVGLRHLIGYLIPGQSGGMIMNSRGEAVGINNVTLTDGEGNPSGQAYSRDLRDTPLCQQQR